MTQPAKAAYLVYFDATDLAWCPDIGPGYVLKGQQLKVDSPGQANPWRALLGSLVYPSGEGLYTIHQKKRHQELRVHLDRLMAFDPEAFWFVVLDNASAHTTDQLEPFWQTHRQHLEPVFLPTYSPHLNLIERLWRLMRGQVTKNQFYKSLILLCEAVVEWLQRLPFHKFCSLMGIDQYDLSFVF